MKVDSKSSKNNLKPSIDAFEVESRRRARWDIENAPKNYLTLVFSQGGIAFFSFSTVWLLTRILGSEGYGSVAAVIVASQLTQIALMWTCTALTRYGVQEFVETRQISETFWARTFIFIPNLLAVVALSPLWLPSLAAWLKLPSNSLPYLLLLIILTAISMHVQFALHAVKLPRAQSILLMGERAVVLIVLVALLAFGKLTWLTAIWAYTISPLVTIVFGSWKLREFVSFIPIFNKSRLKEILIFSLPLPLYSLLSHFSFTHLDAIFILNYLTVADWGVYSVAYQINGLILQLPTLAGTLLMPLFVTVQTGKNDANLKAGYFQHILPLLTLCFGLLCAIIAFLSFFAVPFIFGEEFTQVGSLLWIFSAATVASVPTAVGFLPLSNSTSVTYVQMFAAAAAALFNITFNIWLIPLFGLMGSAWATVAAFSASTLLFAVLLGRRFKLPYLTPIFMVFPSIIGAACFSWTHNVFFSFLAVVVSSAILFFVKRESFLYGLQKLIKFLKNR